MPSCSHVVGMAGGTFNGAMLLALAHGLFVTPVRFHCPNLAGYTFIARARFTRSSKWTTLPLWEHRHSFGRSASPRMEAVSVLVAGIIRRIATSLGRTQVASKRASQASVLMSLELILMRRTPLLMDRTPVVTQACPVFLKRADVSGPIVYMRFLWTILANTCS